MRRLPARVPGVAPAVAVGVVEVVGAPRARRHHDRDPCGRRGRAHDDGGTRPGRRGRRAGRRRRRSASRPRSHRERRRRARVRPPVDRDRWADGNALQFVVRVGRLVSGPLRSICRVSRWRRCARRASAVAGEHAPRGERGIDAEHPYDRVQRLRRAARRARGDAGDVRARGHAGRWRPLSVRRPAPRREVPFAERRLRDRRKAARTPRPGRSRGSERDGRAPRELELEACGRARRDACSGSRTTARRRRRAALGSRRVRPPEDAA